MKSKYRLGKFAGIDVFAHWSLILTLVGLFVWLLWRGRSLTLALDGLVLVAALFVCVILHEFGHALTARRFGIPTLHITMYPIGGIALLGAMPRAPRQELMIAIAGPAVNLAIAAILFAMMLFGEGLSGFGIVFIEDTGRVALMPTLMSMNLVLVAFNLIPAFPMDGGRVLRAALAMKLSYKAATRIASLLGQVLAVAFAFASVVPNPIIPGFNPVLLFVAVFVFAAAREEFTHVAHTEAPPPA